MSMTFLASFAARAFCVFAILLSACASSNEELTNKDAAAYFGLVDGSLHVFEDAQGLREEHQFSLKESTPEGEVYLRLVTRNGFVQDEGSMSFLANIDGLFASEFYDCVIRCAKAEQPFPMLRFPIVEAELEDNESTVNVRDGDLDYSRLERHQFQSSRIQTISTPRGDEEGINVAWTRTIDDSISAMSFSFVPNVGLVKKTGADAVDFVRLDD